MKLFLRILSYMLLASAASAVPINVQKSDGASNNLTAPIVVPSGQSITASGTGTIGATTVTGLSVAAGKTLTASNTLTFAGTDGSTLNVGNGGTLGSLALLSSINNGNWSGTQLSVGNGGTGVTALSGIPFGNGSSAFTAAIDGTDFLSPKSGVINVLNVAALRAYPVATLQNGAQIATQGYYTANDNGNAVYVWNATSMATDNGGTIIQPTGVMTGRFLLRSQGFLSAKQFGAKGDGATDDTTALNNLVTFINTAGGGLVYIPLGTYLTSTGLAFSTGNVTVKGDGIGVTIIKVTAYADCVRFSNGYPASTSILSNITFTDITLDGNFYGTPWSAPNDTYGNGLNLNTCQNFFVNRVQVYGTSGQGIVSTFGPPSPGTQVQTQGYIGQCIVTLDVSTSGKIAIGAEARFSHLVIDGNVIDTSAVSGSVGVYVGNLGPTTGIDNRGVVITNNVCIGPATTGNGILVEENWRAINVSGNNVQFYDVGISLKTAASTALIATVDANVIRDFNSYGINTFPINSGNLQVNCVGNTINSAGASVVDGILLTTGSAAKGNLINIPTPSQGGLYVQDGCTVCGNDIQTGSNASLYLAGSTTTTWVDSNKFSGSISNPTKGTFGVNYSSTGAVLINGLTLSLGTSIKGVRTATATFNFGTVAAGSVSATNVAITGVAQGDSVQLSWTDGSSNGAPIIVDASCNSAGNVLVGIWNPTTSAIVVGSRTFRITVTSF